MTSGNLEIVKTFTGPLLGRDLVPIFADQTQIDAMAAAAESTVDADFEFFAATGGIAALEVNYRGRREALEGLFTGWHEWLSAWDSYVIELEEIHELRDGRILVLTRSFGRSRKGELGLEAEHGLIFRVSHGRILRYEQYFDRNQALEAAGVSARARTHTRPSVDRRPRRTGR